MAASRLYNLRSVFVPFSDTCKANTNAPDESQCYSGLSENTGARCLCEKQTDKIVNYYYSNSKI